MKFVDLSRELRAAGFVEVRCRGTHHRFEHPGYGRITVCREHGNRSVSQGAQSVVRKHLARCREGLSLLQPLGRAR